MVSLFRGVLVGWWSMWFLASCSCFCSCRMGQTALVGVVVARRGVVVGRVGLSILVLLSFCTGLCKGNRACGCCSTTRRNCRVVVEPTSNCIDMVVLAVVVLDFPAAGATRLVPDKSAGTTLCWCCFVWLLGDGLLARAYLVAGMFREMVVVVELVRSWTAPSGGILFGLLSAVEFGPPPSLVLDCMSGWITILWNGR